MLAGALIQRLRMKMVGFMCAKELESHEGKNEGNAREVRGGTERGKILQV